MTTPMKLTTLLSAALVASAPAFADGDRVAAVPLLAKYTQECAACHLAFPPGMLPAASWQRLMNGLPQHFGTDASLDAATANAIGVWLQANAGTHRKLRRETAPPPEDRISRAAWFTREHREITPAVWQRKAIGSASNCVACHTGAAEGSFSEHDLRIPK